MAAVSLYRGIYAGCLLLASQAAVAQTYTYSVVTPPGSVDTRPIAFSDSGAVLGTWANQSVVQGFIYQSGTFTDINYPGAISTNPTGFNEKGDVIGAYTNSDHSTQAFLYRHGIYKTVSAPDASATELVGINRKGEIAGESSAGFGPDFIYKSGTFTTFVRKHNPVPVSISDSGTVIGIFYPNDLKKISSYLYSVSGSLTIIPVQSLDAECTGINIYNSVVGSRYDNEIATGFLYKNGKVRSIAFPGAVGTYPLGISDRGEIAGYYEDSNYHEVAFVRSKQKFIALNPPNSVGAFGLAVDRHGQVLGSYHDQNGVIYVFIATPSN